MRALLLLVLIGCGSATAAPNLAAFTLDAKTSARLATLPVGGKLELAAFPVGPGVFAPVRFERFGIYAPGARIVEVTARGERELPRSNRVELIGETADGTARVALSFDPDGSNVLGNGWSATGAFELRSTHAPGGLQLTAIPSAQALPPGVTPTMTCGDDQLPVTAPPALLQTLAGARIAAAPQGGGSSLRLATVAIDTDTAYMSKLFGNDTTAASNWIANLFGQLNVMYKRDLNVLLLQGTTFLRTSSDPYTATGSPVNQTELTQFGTYWQNNYSSVPRTFAALFSGKSASADSASGLSWINSYCQQASTGGSYSVEQVFTDTGIAISYDALIIGHELGHNFGAFHTQCTDTSGNAPTGSNTIDQCYNADSVGSVACYRGAVSCPVVSPGNPGAPQGTIMSYCNQPGPSGANCGQNVLQFHPVQANVLSGYITSETPACIVPDEIFYNGFE